MCPNNVLYEFILIYRRHLILLIIVFYCQNFIITVFVEMSTTGLKIILYDRRQFISIKGITSDTATVSYDVPQGSVLGPILFLIYVNDIYSCIDNAIVKLFADDTNLFVSGQSTVLIKYLPVPTSV